MLQAIMNTTVSYCCLPESFSTRMELNFAPIEFLEVDRKKVYLFSEVSYLTNNDNNPINNYCKPDSTLLLSYDNQQTYCHYHLVNYLKRAKLLFFEQGKLRISNSPDTLYLPTIKIDSIRKF